MVAENQSWSSPRIHCELAVLELVVLGVVGRYPVGDLIDVELDLL